MAKNEHFQLTPEEAAVVFTALAVADEIALYIAPEIAKVQANLNRRLRNWESLQEYIREKQQQEI